jgi:hypothetical protein
VRSARRATAVAAYADGLRADLRTRSSAALEEAEQARQRWDKAAALAADAEILGAAPDAVSEELRAGAGAATARHTALSRLAEEIEFYPASEVPVAEQLLHKLEDARSTGDPVPALETLAQAVAQRAAGDGATEWMRRAASLGHWTMITPRVGDAFQPDLHQSVSGEGGSIARLLCPGIAREDGSRIAHARVEVERAAVPQPIPLPPATIVLPFGDLGDAGIRPEEAAAAAGHPPRVATETMTEEELIEQAAAAAEDSQITSDPDWDRVTRGPSAFPKTAPMEVAESELEEIHEVEEVEELPIDSPKK